MDLHFQSLDKTGICVIGQTKLQERNEKWEKCHILELQSQSPDHSLIEMLWKDRGFKYISHTPVFNTRRFSALNTFKYILFI